MRAFFNLCKQFVIVCFTKCHINKMQWFIILALPTKGRLQQIPEFELRAKKELLNDRLQQFSVWRHEERDLTAVVLALV